MGFNNLFKLCFQGVKADLKRREEELKASTESGALITGDSSHPANGQLLPGDQRAQGVVGSTLANVLVIVGFAAFAYTVKYVLKSIAQSDDWGHYTVIVENRTSSWIHTLRS